MLLLNDFRDQIEYLLSTYAPRYKQSIESTSSTALEDTYVQFFENMLRSGNSFEQSYGTLVSWALSDISQEQTFGGTNHFPTTPVFVNRSDPSIWIQKLNATELVNTLYGASAPANIRTTLIQEIEAGTLSSTDFVAAFLNAKVSDGIAVPTVNDIHTAVSEFFLTPSTLLFDTDYALTHIYLGAFGRAPDGDGLAYWKAKVGEIGIERTTEALYQGGLDNGELKANVSNTEFVTNFYTSILGRAPDASGLAFWVGKLDAGQLERGVAIYSFVEGISSGTGTAYERDAKYVNNKALVAQEFAGETVGTQLSLATLLKAAKAALEGVNETDYTAMVALESVIDGSLFTKAATTAKVAKIAWLDTDADLLFTDDADAQNDDADDGTAEDAGIALVGITADNAEIVL
jgi:hypothetical protein